MEGNGKVVPDSMQHDIKLQVVPFLLYARK
jgi:hypothetical protein